MFWQRPPVPKLCLATLFFEWQRALGTQFITNVLGVRVTTPHGYLYRAVIGAHPGASTVFQPMLANPRAIVYYATVRVLLQVGERQPTQRALRFWSLDVQALLWNQVTLTN